MWSLLLLAFHFYCAIHEFYKLFCNAHSDATASIRLDVVLRSLSKVSKIRFWNSSDIPIPLSVMVMIILHQSSFSQDFCTTLQDIIPPVFVYFIALLIILRQTSDRCGASIYTYGYIICSVKESGLIFTFCLVVGT